MAQGKVWCKNDMIKSQDVCRQKRIPLVNCVTQTKRKVPSRIWKSSVTPTVAKKRFPLNGASLTTTIDDVRHVRSTVCSVYLFKNEMEYARLLYAVISICERTHVMQFQLWRERIAQ